MYTIEPAHSRARLKCFLISSLLLLPSCTLDPSWEDSPQGQAWNEHRRRYSEELQWQEYVEARKSRN